MKRMNKKILAVSLALLQGTCLTGHAVCLAGEATGEQELSAGLEQEAEIQKTDGEEAPEDSQEVSESEEEIWMTYFDEEGAGSHMDTVKDPLLAQMAVAEAVYPGMAAYPDETEYILDNGVFDSERFDEAYHAWWNDQADRRKLADGHTEGLNAFMTEITGRLLGGTEADNPVYSPINIYLACAMLAQITGGKTQEQILAALHTDSVEALDEEIYTLWNACYRDDMAQKIILGDSLWMDETLLYRTETVQKLADRYYASVYQGDLSSQEMADAVHAWLNEQTGGLLQDQAGNLNWDDRTVLILLSTLYFQANWMDKFQPERTKTGVFHAADGEEEADYMKQDNLMGYYYGDIFSSISRHFEDTGSMVFILPDEGHTVDELWQDEEALQFLSGDPDQWKNHKYTLVHMSIPKFDVAAEFDLKPVMEEMGITDVFRSEAADFSPLLTEPDGGFLSKAQHDVRVRIDEEGVEAAAFTAMVRAGAGMPADEVDFVLDRPFLFVIRSGAGLPLFIGVVNHTEAGQAS